MRIFFARTFAIALVLVLSATGLWATGADEEEPAAAADREMVRDPTTGEMILAPRYGGSISYSSQTDTPVFSNDVWFGGYAAQRSSLGVNEKIALGDWGLDRNVWDFRSDRLPMSAMRPWLAESWEFPDELTVVIKIRDNVFWHDKPPVNGRKLTAKDIEYNYHRYFGLGSGFTEPSPNISLSGQFASVTATDDRTVVFKFTRPVFEPLRHITIGAVRNSNIYAPEVIEQHGDVLDYRVNVGTGPFQLVDWVEGSTFTWERVDNYWDFDEKFPENRLPYIDSVQAVVMREPAARIAAVRSRQIDFLDGAGTSYITSVDDIESLQASNPELQYYERKFRSETSVGLAVTMEPFNDIRVRHAMQMALDLETMNNDYFNGRADWKPEGMIGVTSGAYHTPFEEWPPELQGYYSYDPEGAERLLDEAGYPRGADGIRFTVPFDTHAGRDPGFIELQVAYWRDIGVAVEINTMDGAAFGAHARSGAAQGLTPRESGLTTVSPENDLRQVSYTDATWNIPHGFDPKLEALIDAAQGTTDLEEYTRLAKEADMRLTELHWYLWSPRTVHYLVHQPWIVGFNGELSLGANDVGPVIYARLWIDEQLRDQYVQLVGNGGVADPLPPHQRRNLVASLRDQETPADGAHPVDPQRVGVPLGPLHSRRHHRRHGDADGLPQVPRPRAVGAGPRDRSADPYPVRSLARRHRPARHAGRYPARQGHRRSQDLEARGTHVPTRVDGARHRHGHRPAGGHLLRHSSGHRRRLRRQNGGGVGPSHTQLLAGLDGDHLPRAVVEPGTAHHHGEVPR